MPLTAIPANTAILAANLAVSCHGISVPQLALGVANGLAQYASSGLIVLTVDTGVLGAGKGTGIGMILPPPVLISSLIASFAGAIIIGPFSAPVATCIGIGISQILATAIINTVNPTVGVGAGVATLIPNPVVSIPIFIAAFKAAGLLGIASITMATAVAVGLDSALPTAKGVIVIAGSPSIISSAGAGTGLLS